MKKKDYQKPTTKVVQFQHHGIICTSPPKTLQGEKGNSPEEDIWVEIE